MNRSSWVLIALPAIVAACASDDGGSSADGEGASQADTASTSAGTSTVASTTGEGGSPSAASGGGDGHAGGAGGAGEAGSGGYSGPTPEECWALETEEECLAAGCADFMLVEDLFVVDAHCVAEQRPHCVQSSPQVIFVPASLVRKFDGDGADVIHLGSYRGISGFLDCDPSSFEAHPACCCYGAAGAPGCEGIEDLPEF